MKCRKNKIKILFFISFLLRGLFSLPVFGQNSIEPIGYVIMDNGISYPLELGEDGIYKNQTVNPGGFVEFTGSAPVRILFQSRVHAEENFTPRYEWIFDRSPDFNPSAPKIFDEDIDFRFEDAGLHYVRLIVTFTDEEGNTQVLSTETDHDMVFRISESFLKVPNAFSPNGDGINDVFKVSYQSLVKFNAYVFNRWGKELYKWGLANIDDGWDGTHNGRPVKDGVYFIVIEAEGSDGVKYKHKGDINILRGYSGTGSTSNTGE